MRSLTPALLLALTACRTAPTTCEERVVVVESARLTVLSARKGSWKPSGTLPLTARAVRFSPDGRRLAYLLDQPLGDQMGTTVQLQADGKPPQQLGWAGFRERRAFGLDVTASDVLFLTGEGLRDRTGAVDTQATHPVRGLTVRQNCLQAPFALSEPVCGPALWPMDRRVSTLLARTNAEVIQAGPSTVRRYPMQDAQEGRLGDGGRLFVVVRSQEGGVHDRLLAIAPGTEPRVLLEGPILTSLTLNASGQPRVIRSSGGTMENLLAHAPDEFGGAAVGGDAVEIVDGVVRPIPGLEGKPVRALFSCPSDQETTASDKSPAATF